MGEKQVPTPAPNGQPAPALPAAEIVYYAIPAPVLAEVLNVLNQLPRGQVNALCTQIEQCRRAGE